jgi:hypothetical protein
VRLVVHHDGRVVVTAPRFASKQMIEQFVASKSEWIKEKLAHFKKHPRVLVPKHTKKEIVAYKKQARQLVEARIKHFNAIYNFKFQRIAIRNQKTRWGSCSKKGNLNFNYKIVLLPPELADYIVVHELCHLGELNHSRNFWALVEKTVPNWRELRMSLRKDQIRLQ